MIIEQTAERKVIEVRLSYPEMVNAAQVGVMREIADIKKGRVNQYAGGRNWQNQVAGALGECAAAKGIQVYWSMGVNTYQEPDVGIYQVRTRPKHEFDLILREQDKDDEIFILVTGKNDKYILQGWILGSYGKQKRYLKDPTGKRPAAYFVPQKDLELMERLGPYIDAYQSYAKENSANVREKTS